MFEDSLLIIKSDYLHKRKPVLLKLLAQGFQIQGSRKLLFSPEQAAEFYGGESDDKSFMFQVILLSKGTCEAFILTKENAVTELMNTMICYFGSSVEMQLNVHATYSHDYVQHEITFIFPNYIHEPIITFARYKFIRDPMIKQLVEELYSITCDKNETSQPYSWRKKLAEWVALSNKLVPQVSNQCSSLPNINREEKAQQTAVMAIKTGLPPDLNASAFGTSGQPALEQIAELSRSSAFSSDFMSSSTCISCDSFEAQSVCPNICPPKKMDSCVEFFKKKTMQPLTSVSSIKTFFRKLAMATPESTSSEQEHGAGIEWQPVSESSSECIEAVEKDEQGPIVQFEEEEKHYEGQEEHHHEVGDEEAIMMQEIEHYDDVGVPMSEPISAADMTAQPSVEPSAGALVDAEHDVEEIAKAPPVEHDAVEITGTEEAAKITEAAPEPQPEAQAETVAEAVAEVNDAPEAAIAPEKPTIEPAAEQATAAEAAPQEQPAEDQVAE